MYYFSDPKSQKRSSNDVYQGYEVPAFLIAYIQHKIYLSKDIIVFQYIFTMSLMLHHMICLTVAVHQFF